MIFVYYMVVMNIVAFLLYGLDKRKAVKDERRISEATLISLAVLGGAFGALLGMKIFHHKTKKTKFKITVPLFAALYTLFIAFALYQNYHLVVTDFEYTSNKIPSEIDGYTIVQISDLHNQIFGINEKMLLDKIKAQSPDVIVVTGDVIDMSHTFYEPAEDFFKGAVEIAPVYYITGNHEAWLKDAGGRRQERFEEFISDVEAMGVSFIDDKEVDMGGFMLVGAADDNLRSFEYKGDTDRLNILLAHEPDSVDKYTASDVDLILTGHVHGGQVVIPGKGGLLSPDIGFFPEYYAGAYDVSGKTMIVSRGLGNSVLPFRINNYPEIVVIKLNAAGDRF